MQIKCFPIENENDMQACHVLRHSVFVGEQGVPENIETDGLDPSSRHFGVRSGDQLIATCRVRLMGSAAKVERMAVEKDFRKLGVGGALVKYILHEVARTGDIRVVRLSAQAHAVPFYERLGFRTRGAEYMEAGIPHYDMVLEI